MENIEQDIIIGQLNEDYSIEIIKDFLDITHLKKLDKFDTFDFFNDEKEIFFEIKSRRIKHNKYPTTMIGYNKILEARKYETVYFIFIFEDGNYYYKFDENDNFKINIGGRNDRGKAEYKKYCYIPINKLKKID
jgi:hypothetical protein